MNSSSEIPAGLPTLAELGYDLLATSPRQRFLSLARPFLCVGLYGFFATLGWWPLAILAVMLLFITIVASAHALVHRSLGLPHRLNNIMNLRKRGYQTWPTCGTIKVNDLKNHRRGAMSDSLTLYRTLLEFVWQNGVRFHDLRCLITFVWVLVGL